MFQLTVKAIAAPQITNTFYKDLLLELDTFKASNTKLSVGEMFSHKDDCSGLSLVASVEQEHISVLKLVFEACAKVWLSASKVLDNVAPPMGMPISPPTGTATTTLAINYYISPPNTFNANLKSITDVGSIRHKLESFLSELD